MNFTEDDLFYAILIFTSILAVVSIFEIIFSREEEPETKWPYDSDI